MRPLLPWAVVLALAPALACRTTEPEARSLLGEPHFARDALPADTAALEADLARARRAYEEHPDDEDAIVWYGRRLAYLARYRAALDVFSRGIALHPASFALLRHRGHRWITVRELDAAVADLTRAAELIEGVPDRVEPDGAPNPAGIPRSTSHTNITYHLGLAHYLRGEYAPAVSAYRRCIGYSTNDDMLVAATYWLHLALRRLGREEEARAALEPIHAEMEILENETYHRLLRFYRGELSRDELLLGQDEGSVEDATLGYGIGVFDLLEGRGEEARALFERIVAAPSWPAFGHVAAEADLALESGER